MSAITSIAIAAVLTLSTAGLFQQPAADPVKTAMTKLHADDARERQDGKSRILKLGRTAVPELLTLMQRLLSSPEERAYVAGKEVEAAEAHEKLRKAMEENDNDAGRKIRVRLILTDITDRVAEDTAELLGKIAPEEALPLFISDLYKLKRGNLRWAEWTPSLHGLVTIGAAAVPELLEVIKTAQERAVAIEGSAAHYAITETTMCLQTKAAMVLGRIGDRRALDTLTNLKLEGRRWQGYLDEAIRTILEKSK